MLRDIDTRTIDLGREDAASGDAGAMHRQPAGGSLLVLGANEDQLPVYLEARRLGLSTIAIDRNPRSIAFDHADRHHVTCTRDVDRIIATVGGRPVRGVIAPSSDAALDTARRLSLHYGTSTALTQDAVAASTDKGFFRKLVDHLGLSGYRSLQSGDMQALLRDAAALQMPVVVKPSDSSGSKGIMLVRQHADLLWALRNALAASYAGEVIIEEYVEGRHYSAEVFLRDGGLAAVAISEKEIRALTMVTLSHRMPACLPEAVDEQLRDGLTAIARSLELRDGPLNADFILDRNGRLCFVEMGARMGGNGLPMLIEAAYGISMPRLAIASALGPRPQPHCKPLRHAVLHVLDAGCDGVLERIDRLDTVRADPNLIRLALFAKRGQVVGPLNKSASKLGYLLIAAESHEAAEASLARCLAVLRVRCRRCTDHPGPASRTGTSRRPAAADRPSVF